MLALPHAAIKALKRTYPAVITAFENMFVNRNQGAATGYSRQMKCFAATILMMDDILPKLTATTNLFQTQNLNFSVESTITVLDAIVSNQGPSFLSLANKLDPVNGEWVALGLTYTDQQRPVQSSSI